MDGTNKRKSRLGGGPPKKSASRSKQTCLLHNPALPKSDDHFTPLSSVKCNPDEKLKFLLDIRDRRLEEPTNSSTRMQAVCDLLPTSLDSFDIEVTGYHRRCYQAFTANLRRLQNTPNGPSTSVLLSRSPRKGKAIVSASKQSHQLFPLECIFCDKVSLRVGRKTERPVKFQSWKHKDPSWKCLESQAQVLNRTSILRRIHGEDLFAREAHYHKTCRNRFNTHYRNHCSKNDTDSHATQKTAAHQSSYSLVIKTIHEDVLQKKQVLDVTLLKNLYTQQLKACNFPNDEYRTSRLVEKMKKDNSVNQKIGFCNIKRKGFISTTLIYSSSITLDEAIACTYMLKSYDYIDDVAVCLHKSIKDIHARSTPLPWPPTADDLDKRVTDILPTELNRFLQTLFGGDQSSTNERINRLVSSLGQDICRAVTGGEWKLPKHILLCATIRHMYRCKKLTTILNRLGHSESHNFSLELEGAVAQAVDESSTFLTPTIVTGVHNVVFHNEWDNLNRFTSNVHGSNIVNSAGGIMIQETSGEEAIQQGRRLPELSRQNVPNRKSFPETLPPVTVINRVGPSFPQDATFAHPPSYEQMYKDHLMEYHIWMIARLMSSNGTQEVPGISGFVSATGTAPTKKSTIDYYTPINQPITDYEVVEELLRRSEEATAEVGQQYTINTFDLGVCMKALPLMWKTPERYNHHVVIPGQFHTVMNYIGMLTNHKCRGSGYVEILLEAQLVTSGSLKSTLSGKAYAKAMFCLKTVCEAMDRLLMEKFIEENDINVTPEALLLLTNSCNRKNIDNAKADPSTKLLIDSYISYQDSVRHGGLGKTAKFWLSFTDHCRLVFAMLIAVKTNNLDLFHKCNSEMAVLFFAYDGQNYSRYLSWFDAFLCNIEVTHPGSKSLLRKGAIAVARSLVPGCLSPVDKTMEETFMKFAKSSGGLIGIFNNFSAYQRWCRTTSTRTQYYEKLLETCDLLDDPDSTKNGKHRDLNAAEIRKSEAAVQRTISAIKTFTNPFAISNKDRLYSLASGAPVSSEVEKDVLNAESVGRAARDKFITDRLQHGSVQNFFDPIRRQKLMTMDACNKTVKLSTSTGKLIQYKEQSDLAFQLLVKSQLLDQPLDLEELMKYPLTPIPHALGTPDGFFAKTNKASMMHQVLKQHVTDDVTYPPDAMYIQDGNALFHTLTNLPPTFGGTSFKILDQMVTRKNFIFSTDSYHQDSIKAQERLRRGVSEKFIIDGMSTRMPQDFKLFLSNNDNKTQLCRLLLKAWSTSDAVSRLAKCQSSALVVDGRFFSLVVHEEEVVVNEISKLNSNQEETDTRVVLYLQHAAYLGHKSAVVRTPDTDIFFILLHHAHAITLTIYLDTGVGKNRRLINITQLSETLGNEFCTSLLGLYVFTGEDCTSAFKGKGKVAPLKKLQRNPKYQAVFRQLGENWEVADKNFQQLEEFTCMMYNHPREKSVDAVRYKMLKKMVGDDETLNTKSKVDFARLLPCAASLIPHIQRVNHRLAHYKRAAEPNIIKPEPFDDGQGWLKTDDGILEPRWCVCPFLPPSLVDLVAATYVTNDNRADGEDDSEDDIEVDVDIDIADNDDDDDCDYES